MTCRGLLRHTVRLARGVAPALLILVVGTSDLAAQRQQRGPGPRTGDRAELEGRVRARFAEMMKERLGLTDDQSQALGRAVDSFRDRRRQLNADDQALRAHMQAMLMESDPAPDEARELLMRMEEIRAEEARLFQEEQQALLEVLTPVQLVRFHAMREQLSQRIQQLRGGMGPPGGRRPPGGPGDPVGESLDGLFSEMFPLPER